MNWRWGVLIIATGIMLIFVVQNMEVVQVRFLLWRLEASRVLVYLSLFLIGVVAGWLVRAIRGRR